MFIAEIDDVFYVQTTAQSPNATLIAVPATSGDPKQLARHLPESKFALIDASIVGGRIFAQYLQDAYSVVRAFDLDGKRSTT